MMPMWSLAGMPRRFPSLRKASPLKHKAGGGVMVEGEGRPAAAPPSPLCNGYGCAADPRAPRSSLRLPTVLHGWR